jgi:hypothetical protein
LSQARRETRSSRRSPDRSEGDADSGRRPGPAEHRAQPGQQLVRVEWLIQVVVRALIQRDSPLGRLADLGEQDHRQPAACAAQAAQHLPAVRPGHQHVQHAAVRVEPLHQRQRRIAVRGHVHGKSGPGEEWRQIGSDRIVVVGQDHDRTRIRYAHNPAILLIPCRPCRA